MLEVQKINGLSGIKVILDEEALVSLNLKARLCRGEEVRMAIGIDEAVKAFFLHEEEGPDASVLRLRTDGKAEVVLTDDIVRDYYGLLRQTE